LSDEIVEVVIRLENHVAAATAVPAARAALGYERFAMKRDRAFAAMPRAGENLDLVNKHSVPTKKARSGKTSPWFGKNS
jgi:hypothetical protein